MTRLNTLFLQTGGSTGNGESSKVKELETSLLETRMLYTTSLEDFKIVSSRGAGCKCGLDDHNFVVGYHPRFQDG